jgi:hypothetical protein
VEALDQIEVLRDAAPFGDDGLIFEFGEVRNLDRRDVREQPFDLLVPARVEPVPIREVVAGAPLEDREAPLDLGAVGIANTRELYAPSEMYGASAVIASKAGMGSGKCMPL